MAILNRTSRTFNFIGHQELFNKPHEFFIILTKRCDFTTGYAEGYFAKFISGLRTDKEIMISKEQYDSFLSRYKGTVEFKQIKL